MKHLCGLLVCLFMVLPGPRAWAAESPWKPAGKTHRLVLLRHGESVWNKENRFTGWADVPLTEKGMAGASEAGEILKKKGMSFDAVYTSCLGRAIKTAWLALESLETMWIPVYTDWRLNERCYGDLEGKTRKEVEKASGAEQVKIWRRSFDVPPPPLSDDDPRSPLKDPRYRAVPPDQIPRGESLKDVIARSQPYWDSVLAPAIRSGRNVMVVGHSTALRALSKCIDPSLDEKALQQLEIPNSTPIVYVLDENLKPVSRTVLGGEKAEK